MGLIGGLKTQNILPGQGVYPMIQGGIGEDKEIGLDQQGRRVPPGEGGTLQEGTIYHRGGTGVQPGERCHLGGTGVQPRGIEVPQRGVGVHGEMTDPGVPQEGTEGFRGGMTGAPMAIFPGAGMQIGSQVGMQMGSQVGMEGSQVVVADPGVPQGETGGFREGIVGHPVGTYQGVGMKMGTNLTNLPML